jgi:O-antigen ligase
MNMQSRTAAEGVGSAPPARLEARLTEAAFLAFLLLIFVGLTPFASRNALTVATPEGQGDVLRQIAFLSAFACIAGLALWQKGFAALRAISVPLALTLAWCLLSALWSVEPDVTFRRAILSGVVVVSALFAVEALGIERSLRLLRYALAGILIVNWISVFVLSEAVHLPGDAEEAVVGGWRGLYFHKNIAGAVSAITAIVFLFFALANKRASDWIFFIAAVAFTVMTQSKSSLGFLGIALIFGGFYRLLGRGGLDRAIALVALALVAVVAIGLVMAGWDTVIGFLRDPTHFTGRAAIWQAELAYIGDHPFLGSGFGAFADTGARSPLYPYMGSAWIGAIPHGHSGYLELAVTIGLTGFALALLALVILPARDFLRAMAGQSWFTTLAFTLFAFVALHNIMESDFLESDNPQWAAFLFAIGMARMETRDIKAWS